jgi:uncharacterized MAPEG superfamily protein
VPNPNGIGSLDLLSCATLMQLAIYASQYILDSHIYIVRSHVYQISIVIYVCMNIKLICLCMYI